jgi:hypothetical protein
MAEAFVGGKPAMMRVVAAQPRPFVAKVHGGRVSLWLEFADP